MILIKRDKDFAVNMFRYLQPEDIDGEGIPPDSTKREILAGLEACFDRGTIYSINEDDGYIFIENENGIFGFHLLIRKEKRGFVFAREAMNEVYRLANETGAKKIYTLAKGFKEKLLCHTGNFVKVKDKAFLEFNLYAMEV